MTEREAFIKAICANRADDTVRLAFADWLDEHNDHQRAEFIRVQCELVQLRGIQEGNYGMSDIRILGRIADLRRRERELLDEHRGNWFRLLSRRPGFGENELLRWWPIASNDEEVLDRGDDCPIMTAAMEGRPTRGFLSYVICTAADWTKHGHAICEQNPIERVKLTTRPDIFFLPRVQHLEGGTFEWESYPGIAFGLPDRIARVSLVGESTPIELQVSADVRLWDQIASDAQGRGVPISPEGERPQLIIGTVVGFNDNP